MPEDEKETTEQQRLEKEQLEDLGTVWRTRGPHAIHCLTVIGQIEGHVEAPQGQKTTKYEHVIPQLVAVQEDPAVEGLLVLINTVGGDVEAGLALAELIASISKPSATVVLGGGHSIGIPLAVSAHGDHDGAPGPPLRHDSGRAPDHAVVRADAGAHHRLCGGPQRHYGRALLRADAPHR